MQSAGALYDAIIYDLRYAARGMRRRPGFTAMIVVILALGIGANATMFGILDRLLLQPPAHIADPDRVVLFNVRRLGSDGAQTTQPYVMRTILRDQVSDFDGVAIASPTGVVQRKYYPVGRGESADRVAGSLVSGNYFSVLGVRPALGRFFLPDEDREVNAPTIAVIGYGYWQRKYAGRSDVLGQTIDVGTTRFTIVGVAPAGFIGTEMRDVDVWLPIAAAEGLRLTREPNWATAGDSQWLLVLARLKPGASLRHAEAQATGAYRNWARSRLTQPTSQSLARIDSQYVVLGSLIPGKSLWTWGMSGSASDVSVAKLLGGVSLMVLLIACANVANLLLVRAFGRRREIAVRLALGVSRRRLVAQLVIEGILLAVLGAIGALVIAALVSELMRRWLIGDGAWTGSAVSGRVLVFTGGVALLTGLITALVPAVQATRPELTSALKSGARDGSVHRSNTRSALLVLQAALAILLLAGAGMFIRSLRKVAALDLGVAIDRVLVAEANHSVINLSNADARTMFARFAERARTVPGISGSAVSIGLPFGLSWGTRASVPGRERPQLRQGPMQYAVLGDYFGVLGIRVLSGRAFTDADGETAPRVAIVNETFARQFLGTESPIGACVRIGADTMPCTTIVGVVTNTRRQDLVEEPVAQIYRPLYQVPMSTTNGVVSFFGYTMIARAKGDPKTLIEPLRRALQSVGPSVPYANVQPMHSLLGRQTRAWELGARAFTAFGLVALVLAAIGLFSVVAFTIGQRMHEFGIRSALGAQASDLMRLTMVRGLAPALFGIGLGVGLTLIGGRFVGALLFQVSPRDPLVLGGASLVLFLAAGVASLGPSIKAGRVDPTTALRAE